MPSQLHLENLDFEGSPKTVAGEQLAQLSFGQFLVDRCAKHAARVEPLGCTPYKL
jgi:hypothetical protein